MRPIGPTRCVRLGVSQTRGSGAHAWPPAAGRAAPKCRPVAPSWRPAEIINYRFAHQAEYRSSWCEYKVAARLIWRAYRGLAGRGSIWTRAPIDSGASGRQFEEIIIICGDGAQPTGPGLGLARPIKSPSGDFKVAQHRAAPAERR